MCLILVIVGVISLDSILCTEDLGLCFKHLQIVGTEMQNYFWFMIHLNKAKDSCEF